MAYTTINKSTDYFETTTYTGGATDVSSLSFQPDFVWAKKRDGAENHGLFDAVRGATKTLSSNATSAESTRSGSLTSFDNDGWSMGGSDGIISASGSTYVGWAWKANGAGSANTDGSISSTVSVNTTAGFSIVKWTGNGGTASVGHGLGVKPNIVIKNNLGASTNWIFSTTIIDGSNDFFYLNSTDAKGNSGETAPTASLINLYANSENNGNGNDMIAYCFAEKTGYSKFGSYTGNGNADGTFVYTGFKPAFVIWKNTTAAGYYWHTMDNKREPNNPAGLNLFPNLSNAENDYGDTCDFVSNGFKFRTGSSGLNTNGQVYIYMAFAEAPLVGTNNVPANAR